MSILYIVVVVLVTFLLLSIPLYPFWKVWHRVKHYHPDLWNEKGPFDLGTLVGHPDVLRGLFDIITLADKDEVLMKKDPELIEWTRFAREVWVMLPRSFLGQIGYFVVFLYFVSFFTKVILGFFG